MIDLFPFCGDDEGWSLGAPWPMGEWMVATNQDILVRQKCAGGEDDVEVAGLTLPYDHVVSLFDARYPRPSDPGAWTQWPRHDGATIIVKCGSCGGAGYVWGSDDERVCPTCSGSGLEQTPKPLVIAGRIIAGKYCRKIEDIGQVEFFDDGDHPERALMFRMGETVQGMVEGLERIPIAMETN
jgi:hypothetical protein